MTTSVRRYLHVLSSRWLHDDHDKDSVQSIGLLAAGDLESPGADPRASAKTISASTFSTLMLSIVALVKLVIFAFIPSFVQSLWRPASEPRKIHPTSFLDGVRGVASFIVAYAHLIPAYEQWLAPSFGKNYDDELGSSILQLPFLRVFMANRPMVHIFMVISGFVLSIKPVQYMRRGDFEKMYNTLASMAFCRGIRLFLPSVAGMALMEVTAAMGWQSWQSEPSLWGKLHSVYINAGHLLYSSWRWDHENSKELLQLWTIPVEFACSMLLFIVLLAVSKLRTWVRFAFVGMLALHSHASMHWGPFEFLSGLILAELEEILAERRKRQMTGTNPAAASGQEQLATKKSWSRWDASTVFWVFALLLGLFLAGYPDRDAETTFGLSFFTRLTPQIYYDGGAPLPSFFWFSIAAVLLIASLFRLPAAQRVFTTSVAQYLGDISYGVYIVHYSTVLITTSTIQRKAHEISGGIDTHLKRLVVVFLELVMLMTIVIWQADIFWRFIDKPSVRLAKKLETLCKRPDT